MTRMLFYLFVKSNQIKFIRSQILDLTSIRIYHLLFLLVVVFSFFLFFCVALLIILIIIPMVIIISIFIVLKLLKNSRNFL